MTGGMNAESEFLIANPERLWLIWVIPVLCACAWAGWRWSRRVILKHFSEDLARRLCGSVSWARRWIKLALLCGSLFFSIFALADPKWGVAEQTVLTGGRDILILLDVSKSMLATDVAPSRLERVKLDIQDMLGVLKGDRIGLVVFAGTPVLKCPLTTDYGFFRQVLARVGVHSVTRGGTFIGDAIREGLQAFTDKIPNNKVMILISDGEDQGSFPLEAARLAAERGIRIYTVGVGDRDVGSRILVEGEYVKDDGQAVWTKLNPEELRKIAAETSGAYVPAGTRSVDLDRIFLQKIASTGQAEESATKRKYMETRYQLFLTIALTLLLIECFVSERPAGPGRSRTAARGAAALGLAVFAGLFLPPIPANAADHPFDLYNEGRRQYYSGELEKAADLFSKAADDKGMDLGTDALYNLGNVHVKQAERLKDSNVDAAIQSLRMAESAYTESLDHRPGMDDAKHNLELTRRLLKQLEEQKKKQELQKNQKQQGGQGDTGSGKPEGDTAAAQQQKQQGAGQGPKDQGRSFDKQDAEKNMKDRLKDIEELKQRLMQAARQKGIDPEKEQDKPAGVIVGGSYKDW